MHEALLVVFLIVAIGLVGLIMLQQGKGADMGASFGAGASGTLFGSSGSGNFMTRMTAVLGTLFFIISLVLGNMNSNKTNKGSEWENLSAPAKTEQTQPAAPAQPTSAETGEARKYPPHRHAAVPPAGTQKVRTPGYALPDYPGPVLFTGRTGPAGNLLPAI